MIILKHLTIERFRLLRSMNLHFPQRGSILIQGPNEAGKSALIESIYFALYGEPLLLSRGKYLLDDLILYGAASAHVTLVLSVGATELSIARTIERGRGQIVNLQIRRLGMPEEALITDLAAANTRIIAELGRMNGEALRDSSLIEQKGLTRLESISGIKRETTIRKLLGIEKLLELTEQFQVGPDDEQRLKECSEYLRLTEMQARIPQVSEQLNRVEAALDAVATCESLDVINQQESEIAELEQTLEEIQDRRLKLKSRQSRIQQLKKADTTLSEIISSYDEMAEARRMLPELEDEIAELERREREELPKLEKRVSELAELTRSFGTL
ncbi:MAG TPA: AAA family ATPase, partial [Ktedonobacteraceae bacterium]